MRKLLAFLGALLLLPSPCPGEFLGPGSYRGWVRVDRWGNLSLANGVYLLPVSGKARAALLPHKDRPVDVDVTRIDQRSDLEWVIAEVGGVKAAAPAHGGKLDVALTHATVEGHALLRLRVEYGAQAPLTFRLRHLRVLLRRRGPPCALDDGYAEARDDEGTPWVGGGWGTRTLEDERLREEFQVYRAPGGTLEAQGPFAYETGLTVTLPAGEYEAWAIAGDANYSHPPDARSPFLAFDVPER